MKFLSGILAVFLFSAVAPGQSVRGLITGSVTDASQKPLAGVSLVLVQEETNKRRTVTTDAQGKFTLAQLPPGGYRLEVEGDGYRKQVQQIVLQLNQEARIEVALAPGKQTETVVVTATLSVLRTESAALATVIENRQITGLPLDGRNYLELSLLVPGAAPAAPGSAGSVRGDFALNINGAREDSNNFLLDGVYNGDPKLNTFGVNPPVDAVREFEVLTNGYDASFGRDGGGQINVVLKSGTNQLHGTAYEFFRNRELDARNFFAPAGEAKPQNQRNQFGFSLGGPVVRNRTFFFADYEGRRVREGITRITNVPTAAERVGNFSQSRLFAIDLFTQRPFPGNRIPQERLHPVGAGIAALYPLPNRRVPQQNFVSSPALDDRDDHVDLRVDHALSRGSELSFRYSFADRSLFEPFSGPQFALVPGYGTNVPRRAQNAMASETHSFSSNFLNELRLGFNRVSAGSFHQNMGRSLNRVVGLPEVSSNPRDFGLSYITLTGYSPLGDEINNPQHSASNIYQIVDHATWTRSRHLVKFGTDLRVLQQNAFRDVESRGFLNFLGLTGNSLAEMLQGFPSVTGAARLDNHQHLRTHSSHFFVHETWRVRPDLTLTAGVRYEYNSPPVDAEDRANTYDRATQSLVRVGRAGIPRAGYEADRNNFAPRLGLAWTRGRTVLRTGYGLYYDQAALAPGEGLYFNAPYFDFKLYFPLGEQLPLTLSDPFPKFFPISLPSSALAFQRDLRTAYIQHWNFSVQQQVGRNRMVELAYAGSKGTKLLQARDINQPRPSPRTPNLRPAPQFDDINALESRGSSSYHSLQSRFQQNLSRGLSALASYTWSKSIDDASSFFSSAGDPNYPQDSGNVRLDRGRSNFDLRHRLSLAYSYDLQWGKGRWWGGWQTFGIWTFQTGRPFTVALLSDLDNSNTGRSILGFGANDRPNVVRNPALSNPTPERWFDTAAFAVPPFGSFGNAGRNMLNGPSYQNVSLSVVKNVALRAGQLPVSGGGVQHVQPGELRAAGHFCGITDVRADSIGGQPAADPVRGQGAVLVAAR
ncbi:MAG: TonB-dependent receptor [Acidobacteria bacterium]|nr:TonB-dependent receptor [Acidobacteriota bacterium]